MAGITRGTKYVICMDYHVNIRLRFPKSENILRIAPE